MLNPFRFTFLSFILVVLCFPMRAQDLHFSQPYMNPLGVNPALTGVFEGPWRAMAAYRDQWSSVPVTFRTVTAAADLKVWQKGNGQAAGGVFIGNDQAGDLGLRWFQAGVSGSYTQALGEMHALTAGIGLYFVQRTVGFGDIRVQNQWDGEMYNPGLPTKEPLGTNTGVRPSLSAGLNWHIQPWRSRTYLNLGAAGSHLNQPELTFDDAISYNLPVRLTASFDGALELSDGTDLVGFGLWQNMQSAQEIVAGAGVRQIITTGAANHTALSLRLGTRFSDAIIPAIQVERNNWTFGFSYDVNISEFDVATNNRGGFEMALIYRPIPVPPVKAFKSCPIF